MFTTTRKANDMKKLSPIFALAALSAVVFAAPALADDVKAGDLVISQAWSRATPGGAKVAGGYLTIWCDGSREATTNFQANLNTGHSLDGNSGGAYLFNAAGQAVDYVEYGFQVENRSIGLTGAAGWRLLSAPTPGAFNSLIAPLGNSSALRINEWMANPADGPDWWWICLAETPATCGCRSATRTTASFHRPGWRTFTAGRPWAWCSPRRTTR